MDLGSRHITSHETAARALSRHHLYRALAYTLAALALLIPANLYPFMTMHYADQFKYATVWDGVRSLYDSGTWITATIVFMASVIIPIFKLLAMMFIILTKLRHVAGVERASLLIFIDFIGRWSMLDIFIVAIIKFGRYATVTADIASYLFGGVVIFTMLASATLTYRHRTLYSKDDDE